jgi:hypothetical protein
MRARSRATMRGSCSVRALQPSMLAAQRGAWQQELPSRCHQLASDQHARPPVHPSNTSQYTNPPGKPQLPQVCPANMFAAPHPRQLALWQRLAPQKRAARSRALQPTQLRDIDPS